MQVEIIDDFAGASVVGYKETLVSSRDVGNFINIYKDSASKYCNHPDKTDAAYAKLIESNTALN